MLRSYLVDTYYPDEGKYGEARTYDARTAVESAEHSRSISSREFISVTQIKSWWERSG
jgi:hypothetical protein